MNAPVRKCEVCDDTGRRDREGFDLDCIACEVAGQRISMNDFIKEQDRKTLWKEDIAWAIHQRAYQLGKAAATDAKDSIRGSALDLKGLLFAIIDIYYDGIENAPGEGCYIDGAFANIMAEARAALAAGAANVTAAPVVPVAAQPTQTIREGFEQAAKALHERAKGWHKTGNYTRRDECLQCESMLNDMKPVAAPSLEAQPAGEVEKAEVKLLEFAKLFAKENIEGDALHDDDSSDSALVEASDERYNKFKSELSDAYLEYRAAMEQGENNEPT